LPRRLCFRARDLAKRQRFAQRIDQDLHIRLADLIVDGDPSAIERILSRRNDQEEGWAFGSFSSLARLNVQLLFFLKVGSGAHRAAEV
jgi:hypothetical protein